ncbi:MAG: hypothetical protein H7328_09120 [Bdellovibrio sp.]|nr:hypothetical protein [Bdellovibrio sp.]
MINKFQQIIKVFIVICLTAGVFLLAKKSYNKKVLQKSYTNSKLVTLKKYLIGHEKPQRVEIFSYTQRFEKDVAEIKKLKIAQSPQSNFYVTIQFFTDESDATAPLIAQIRFVDIKSGNQIKEESLNLE